jgi:DNA (cytosine-5)-methyltransferase 1
VNVLSLFSGVGGLDLGLERAGMTVVGQVEIDEFCRQVLAKHWPAVPQHDDVRTFVDWWASAVRPPVDLVCGGAPCQPVSVAGRQLAQDDERWLWPHMVDVIRAVRPRWVLLENVPGLLGRLLGDVLGDLAAGGYDAEWDCVPAAAVGAPHLRDRVYVVAYPHSIRRDGWSPVFGQRWRGQPEDSGWWAVEPDVGRVALRVPGRVDRLRALGNAVVPQVAEHLGRLILAADAVALGVAS